MGRKSTSRRSKRNLGLQHQFPLLGFKNVTYDENSSACAYAQSSLLIDRPAQKPLWIAHMDLPTDDFSVTDDISFTPLHHIVLGLEKADLRQQLRMSRNEIDIRDSFGRSLLHWAVIIGNHEAVQILLDHKASPNCVDKEQMTPLHDIFLAPSSSQTDCARSLLDAGAEVDALDFWGRSPFRIAVGYATVSTDLLAVLIENGADVNCIDIYSQSPLLKSMQGRKEATELLLSHQADMEARDEYGNTPILEAIYRDKPDRVRMLLEHGANTQGYFELKPGRRARNGRIHLLDFVVWHGSVETMSILEEFTTAAPAAQQEQQRRQRYYLTQSLDTLHQCQDFRMAYGRKTGVEEHKTLSRMLSKIELCYDEENPDPQSDLIESDSDNGDDDDDDDEEEDEFVDAHDSIS